MLCYFCGHLILFLQLHHQHCISCRIFNICVVIAFIFRLFFLYVLSVYAPWFNKILSYLILSYLILLFFCWDKIDNFGVMPVFFLYYMTLTKDVLSCDCYYNYLKYSYLNYNWKNWIGIIFHLFTTVCKYRVSTLQQS